MKQLFWGIVIGVLLSLVWVFVFFNVFSLKEGENTPNGWPENHWNKDGQEISQNQSNQDEEQVLIPEENTISMEYVKNHQEILLEESSMDDFKEQSSYKFSVILYALRFNNIDIWNSYWMSLYNSLEDKPFEKEIYSVKIEEAFYKIQENILDMEEYLPYLLDGAIYFSSESLENKQTICEQKFSEIEWDGAPSDGIEYCKSLSYVYEAIRMNDVSYCSQIPYEPQDTALIQNCTSLFELN